MLPTARASPCVPLQSKAPCPAISAPFSAVNEVATLMQNVIQHAENDGTYSAGEFGYAR